MGIEIVDDVFRLTKDFPIEEKFSLISQINRSSVSIPSNIAEGSSRSEKSFSHFLDIALGSLFELETQLVIANRRNDLTKEDLNNIEEKISEFQKMTMGFQNNL